MKSYPFILLFFITFAACRPIVNKETIKQEVIETEKAFEKMAADSGIAIAFHHFADENATILRGNDSIIGGREKILHYYLQKKNQNATVTWKPDFVEVSDDGTLAYTYGKYCWKIRTDEGSMKEFRGVFHTVWKKQTNGTWKYVWD